MFRGVRRGGEQYIAGIELGDWVRIYVNTHDASGQRIEWPDGEAYFDQPTLLIEVFHIIKTEHDKLRQEDAKRGKRN